MIVELPLKTLSLTNCRLHWRKIASIHKKQKLLVRLSLKPLLQESPLPCIVKLTRSSRGKLDDDNLPTAFKAIRDEIADILLPGLPPGRADDSPLIQWVYNQKKGPIGIEIEICPTKQQS